MKNLYAGRLLFARIGWMTFYSGIVQGDSELIGGGSYNTTDVGSEVLNFAPQTGRVYGFAQGVRESGIALHRIAASRAEQEALHDVLIVFVSRRPKQPGQVIIGWYHRATVYREARPDPRKRHGERWFNAEVTTKDAILLPTRQRWTTIPNGAGAFGKANVCYALQPDGSAKNVAWMRQALNYVLSYDGPNLVTNPRVEAENQAVEQAESVAAAGQGQGFPSTPAQRRAIERHAMARAKSYFSKRFSNVQDVSASKGVLDLRCSSRSRELRVEVKGTTTDGQSVILTRREVELARSRGEHALYVLHSIQLRPDGTATGGIERVLNTWDIRKGTLAPMSYAYKLP